MGLKKILIVLSSFLSLLFTPASANETGLILVPEDGQGEVLLIEDAQNLQHETSVNEEEINEDLELVEDFAKIEEKSFADLATFSAQVSGSIMVLEVRGSAGLSLLNDYLEVGVDAAAMLVGAGDGAIVSSVGAYAKIYVLPTSKGKYYIKGRAYKAWGFADDYSGIQMEYGIGKQSNHGDFFELTVKDFQGKDGDRFLFPFVTFGYKFRTNSNGEEELVDLDE